MMRESQPWRGPAWSLARSTRGSDARSGLNGRAVHPKKPQTTSTSAGPAPSCTRNGSVPPGGRWYVSSSGVARSPGALASRCGSPCGKQITSPASSWSGASPTRPPRQRPRLMAWNSMTCSAPGITCRAMAAEAGASATHGGAHSTWKKTEPVRRTEESRSASGSAPIEAPSGGRRPGMLPGATPSSRGRTGKGDGEPSRFQAAGSLGKGRRLRHLEIGIGPGAT